MSSLILVLNKPDTSESRLILASLKKFVEIHHYLPCENPGKNP